MTDIQCKIAEVLIDIEAELRRLSLWQDEPPEASAMQSDQPFCIDTLSFAQWLQLVFIPTMYRLLDTDQALPDKCGIAPMAEEYFRGMELASGKLENVLTRVDQILSGGKGDRP